MRVLLDASFALRGASGTGVYIERLIPALGALGVDVVEAANDSRGDPGGGPWRSLRNHLSDARWTRLELARLARAEDIDVIHHPLPARTPASPCPQVVSVHDLAFLQRPDLFASGYRQWAALAHRRAARAAAAVIVVSEATAGEVSARWQIPPERIVVAHHGPGQLGRRRCRAEPGHQHFLYVGDNEPRKNLDAVLAAYQAYRAGVSARLPLILAGAAARLASGQDGVRGEPAPDADRLAELYRGAAALVHLSLVEGFGLTLLEAMTAGTPVIAASIPAVRELCADALLAVEPGDADGVAAAMARLAGDATLRAELGARGLARAAAFSWERSARAHLAAYSLALTG
ncbi:MAG: glycosyltransferase family 4 protein [Solirubrobacteraceae bacterium]